MDQNPYAPPRRNVDLLSQSQDVVAGEPRGWSIGDVISEAWGVFKQHWPVLLSAIFVFYGAIFAAQFVVGMVLRMVGIANEGVVGRGITFLVSLVAPQFVGAFFQVGMNRIILAAVRGQTPDFGMLFNGGDRFIVAFLSTVIFTLGMYAGMLLLIVPGIILMLGWSNTIWFVADSNKSPVEALRASWDSMNGHKAHYFAFAFVLGLLNIGGALACLVGLLATGPVTLIAMAIVYTRVTGRMGEPVLSASPAY